MPRGSSKPLPDGPSSIGARMRRLGYPPDAKYGDYLASRHWLHVQLRYSESGLPQACACGKPREALHHKTYARLGDERLIDLEPVCDACHRERHGLSSKQGTKPRRTTKGETRRAKRRKRRSPAMPGDLSRSLEAMKARNAKRFAPSKTDSTSAAD